MTHIFKSFDTVEITVPEEDYSIAVKLDSFCSSYKKVKTDYPAYFHKGKCGPSFNNFVMEPKLGISHNEQNYSSYKGVYFDFNTEDNTVTLLIDGTESLYINKNNYTFFNNDINTCCKLIDFSSATLNAIKEEYENCPSVPYILAYFSEDTMELALFLFYIMSEEEKSIVFDFFNM